MAENMDHKGACSVPLVCFRGLILARWSLPPPPSALWTTDKPHIPMGATGQAGYRFQRVGPTLLLVRALELGMGGHFCGGPPQNKAGGSL